MSDCKHEFYFYVQCKCGKYASDVIEELKVKMERHEKLVELITNGILHADVYGTGEVSTKALSSLIDRTLKGVE